MDTVREGRVGRIEKVAVTCIHYHVKERPPGETAAQRREPSLARCDSLDGRDRRWVVGSRGILRQKTTKLNLILKILKKTLNNLTLKICSNKGKMDKKGN